MWGGQGLRAGAHILTAWLLMSFCVCFTLLGSFYCVYPFPIHPSWHDKYLAASTDFQCDSAWWFPPTGCHAYPAQSIGSACLMAPPSSGTLPHAYLLLMGLIK